MPTPSQPGTPRGRVSGAEVPALFNPARRGGVMRGYLYNIVGSSRSVILYLVLLIGAFVDIATFYQVLAQVLRDAPEEVIWGGVVGFTATALTLAHMLGARLRDHVAGNHPFWTSPIAWLCVVIWLFVGATAFIIRLLVKDTGESTYIVDGQEVRLDGTDGISTTTALLPALLFLALYFATGTVAALAGYTSHRPEVKIYRRATAKRRRAARATARHEGQFAQATDTVSLLDKRQKRVLDDVKRAEDEAAALARRLRQQARILLEARRTSGRDSGPWPPRPPGGAPRLGVHHRDGFRPPHQGRRPSPMDGGSVQDHTYPYRDEPERDERETTPPAPGALGGTTPDPPGRGNPQEDKG